MSHVPHRRPKVLFILKKREQVDPDCSYGSNTEISTGLYNSAKFVNDMLVANRIESSMVVVTDNNDIDREVTKHKPTHVIIEALWVVPEKFDILERLHPDVRWIIRFHSNTPFIANEGIAMDWIFKYVKHNNVDLAVNSVSFLNDVSMLLVAAGYSDEFITDRLHYLPNYYPVPNHVTPVNHKHDPFVDVGCFGAIRPLKNHLAQAIAAIQFGDMIGAIVRFHINIGRVEQKGEPILRNLQALFDNTLGHELIVHQWCPHEEFLKIVKEMDIGLQISFSETFNIVAADMLTCGVPIVVSKEISWAEVDVVENPTDVEQMSLVITKAWESAGNNVRHNIKGLRMFSDTAIQAWKDVFLHKFK